MKQIQNQFKKVSCYCLIAITIIGCSRNRLDPNSGDQIENTLARSVTTMSLPIANGQPVTMNIDQTQPGYIISDNFQGLCVASNELGKNTNYMTIKNPIMMNLVKNLGGGTIRYATGTNSVWCGHPRIASTGDSLATSDIDSIASFARATGWKAIIGLNQGQYDPARNALAAQYIVNTLNSNLLFLQFGNEPDLFKGGDRPSTYNYSAYKTEWDAYKTATTALVPQVLLGGPDVSVHGSSWAINMDADEHDSLKMLSGHYYHVSNTAATTIESILSPSVRMTNILQNFGTATSAHNVPFRISECNSVSSGGKQGVSDVFASALWGLDFMWQIAKANGRGVNMIGRATSNYTPISGSGSATAPRPLYYGMLAFKYGAVSGGNILPATVITNNYRCSGYACIKDGKTYATLINMDSTNLSYTINLNNVAAKVYLARLTAPTVDATTGITFSGNSVNANGTYTLGTMERYTLSANTAVINVPARSAVVAIFE